MDKWLYRSSIALAALGLLVSIYMTVYKLTENPNMCMGNGGCSVVNSSKYAEIYGIPVAVVGMGGYVVILLLLLLEPRIPFLTDNGTMIVFGLALIGFLFTLYLVYVELALIHALCPFCVTSQITMTVLFILSVIRLVRQPSN
ncbi:MAG TPA: vitamin K epoxide reductase family protein [Anaerolineales bacterium]|nr:vitamin K epoxide reductase family protein [Anaerolineales bacterium]